MTMPPTKKKSNEEDVSGAMRAARFGRVKNDLSMGFVGLPNVGKSSLTNLLAGAAHAEVNKMSLICRWLRVLNICI